MKKCKNRGGLQDQGPALHTGEQDTLVTGISPLEALFRRLQSLWPPSSGWLHFRLSQE